MDLLIRKLPEDVKKTLNEMAEFHRMSLPAAAIRLMRRGLDVDTMSTSRRHGVDTEESRPEFKSDAQKESEKYPGMVREVWKHYMAVIGRNPKQYTLTKKRMRMGIARLRDLVERGIAEENRVKLMQGCVDGLHRSEFHNGQNEQGKKWLDWELLFRSTEQMEKWLVPGRWGKGGGA